MTLNLECGLIKYLCNLNDVFSMRILWLSNLVFTDEPLKTTASWLMPLAEGISEVDGIDVVNVSQGDVRETIKYLHHKITQYVIPVFKTRKVSNIPHRLSCEAVAQIVKDTNPDIIHVWGTESIWANMITKGVFSNKPTLIDIQGLLHIYYYYYYGGLSLDEQLACIHTKEFLMPWRNLIFKKQNFRKRGLVETESLKKYQHISYQSEWVKNQLQMVNPLAQYYPTRIMLREAFYLSEKWHYHFNPQHPIIFTICSGAIPYKGIHVLLKAANVLKQKYDNLEVRIAGQMFIGNRMLDGYSVFIGKLIKKYGLTNHVTLLGPIDENEIMHEELMADVCVIPSFVETYCLALAEAMIVGCPTVVSYTSALPYTSIPESESLFYNSIDFVQCAAQIDKLFCNKELANVMSVNSIKHREMDNDREEVIKTQINIYKNILTGRS